MPIGKKKCELFSFPPDMEEEDAYEKEKISSPAILDILPSSVAIQEEDDEALAPPRKKQAVIMHTAPFVVGILMKRKGDRYAATLHELAATKQAAHGIAPEGGEDPSESRPLTPLELDENWIPHHSHVMAWRNPRFWMRIRRRFTQVKDLPPHPMTGLVRTDFESLRPDGEPVHDYFIWGALTPGEDLDVTEGGTITRPAWVFERSDDGLQGWLLKDTRNGWYKPSDMMKILWDGFDSDYRARTLSQGSTNLKYVNKTEGEIKGMWNKGRDRGSALHNSYEYILYEHDRQLPEDMTPAPPGFYRMLAEIHLEWDIAGTETALVHWPKKRIGESDLELRHRQTNEKLQADFKNCDDDDFFEENKDKTRAGNMGRHPVSVDLKAHRGNKYTYQVSDYREMQVRTLPGLVPGFTAEKFSKNICLMNFNPTNPDAYRVYFVAGMDMTFLWDTYFPWQPDDPKHQHFPGPTLIPRFDDNDPRCQGPTRRERVIPNQYDPETMVWCGKLWLSGYDKQEKSARQKKITARKRDNLPYEHLLEPHDLRESIWKHPWDCFHLPIGNRGYYERYVSNSLPLLEQIPTLHGKIIVCWCPEKESKCHGNVLVKLANLWGNKAWTVPLDDF
jgi:hypothetical protein